MPPKERSGLRYGTGHEVLDNPRDTVHFRVYSEDQLQLLWIPKTPGDICNPKSPTATFQEPWDDKDKGPFMNLTEFTKVFRICQIWSVLGADAYHNVPRSHSDVAGTSLRIYFRYCDPLENRGFSKWQWRTGKHLKYTFCNLVLGVLHRDYSLFLAANRYIQAEPETPASQ